MASIGSSTNWGTSSKERPKAEAFHGYIKRQKEISLVVRSKIKNIEAALTCIYMKLSAMKNVKIMFNTFNDFIDLVLNIDHV